MPIDRNTNIVKMLVFQVTWSIDLMHLIKITESYVVDVAKPILKLIRKGKDRIAKTILKKRRNSEDWYNLI